MSLRTTAGTKDACPATNTPSEGLGLMWSWRKLALAAVVSVAALVAPSVVSAQSGTLTGKVVDKATKQPLGDVQVVVKGSLNGTTTKANGTYTILGIPPGVYTVEAKRIGYGTVEAAGVTINIDARRTQDFELDPASTTLGTVTIQAQTTPLVEQGVVGATTTITNEMINALPVTSISEVLALQQGFQELPQNTNVMSLAEEKRSTVASASTRGSRGGSTVNVVDGIPVNNPLFGNSAINLSTVAVAQTQFSRGYMEPQYGGGLSGIVNSAIREGGERFEGSVDYQTTALVGALGSRPDELEAAHLFRGYVAGPVPGTSNKLRYSMAGQVQSSKARVIQFDNDINRFNEPDLVTTGPGNDGSGPLDLDLTPGWQAFGGTQNQQMVGKLTFLPTGSSKFYISGVSENRQNQPYNRNYGLTYGGDPWNRVTNLMDSLGLNGGSRNFQHVIQASARSSAQLFAAGFEQRFSRSTLLVKVGRQEFDRMTCSIWQGVCIEDRYWEGNFTENFKNPFGNPTTSGVPYFGTDLRWGGETYSSTAFRADVIAQATDHHRVQVGASYTKYDVDYQEVIGIDGNSGNVTTVTMAYRAKPIDISSYIQDVIEYDFLTINLGIRYDYGLAKGKGFTNPLNATNGTTAREVCEGDVAGIPEFTFGSQRGIIACLASPANAAGKPTLLDSATRLAQFDDFKEADARTAFSPRIGISFPLTEQSQMFFNAGRYTKSPAYHDLYRNSGVGTISGSRAEGGDNFCNAAQVKPGTTECHPPLIFNNPEFIGNPNLLLEQGTSYEVGYAAQIGASGQYAINVNVFNRDESGLTGTRPNTAIQDVGSTYNSNALPTYTTVVNQDFSTARGIEIQFRRQPRTSPFSYDINYGWSRVTENGPPPDRAFEAQENGEINVASTRRELISGRDRGHSFNLTLGARWNQSNVPKFKGGSLLKNSGATLTYRFAQGQRYTPQRNVSLSGIAGNTNSASDQNSAFGPAQHQADLRVNKDMQLGNARYGVFVRVTNVFNLENCLQVFNNTGACDTGQRETNQRREGNGSGNSSTNRDQPEFRSQTRRFNTGITITF